MIGWSVSTCFPWAWKSTTLKMTRCQGGNLGRKESRLRKWCSQCRQYTRLLNTRRIMLVIHLGLNKLSIRVTEGHPKESNRKCPKLSVIRLCLLFKTCQYQKKISRFKDQYRESLLLRIFRGFLVWLQTRTPLSMADLTKFRRWDANWTLLTRMDSKYLPNLISRPTARRFQKRQRARKSIPWSAKVSIHGLEI